MCGVAGWGFASIRQGAMSTSAAYTTWVCVVCGFLYDEAKGLPEEGIAPGTRWADIPDDWQCPECGVSKADFEMVEA